MKNLIKRFSFFGLVALASLLLVGCAITEKTELKFVTFPEAEYVSKEVSNEEFLEKVEVEVGGIKYSLKDLKDNGAIITGVDLVNEGAHTLMVNFDGSTIIYEYFVVNAEQAKWAVGDEEYQEGDLSLAFAAANENQGTLVKVQLLSNVEVTKSLELNSKAQLELDLNTHKIYYVSEEEESTYLIQNSGELLIKGEGTIQFLALYPDIDWGTVGYPTYFSNTIVNRGKLTVDGDLLIENQTPTGGASYCIDNFAGSSLVIENGTILQSGGDCAIRLSSGSSSSSIDVQINGGTISGSHGIWLHLSGSDATIAPTIAPEINLTINGGTISGTSAAFSCKSWGNLFTGVTITVNGGTIKGADVLLRNLDKVVVLADNNAINFNVEEKGCFEVDVINRNTAAGDVVIYSKDAE